MDSLILLRQVLVQYLGVAGFSPTILRSGPYLTRQVRASRVSQQAMNQALAGEVLPGIDDASGNRR